MTFFLSPQSRKSIHSSLVDLLPTAADSMGIVVTVTVSPAILYVVPLTLVVQELSVGPQRFFRRNFSIDRLRLGVSMEGVSQGSSCATMLDLPPIHSSTSTAATLTALRMERANSSKCTPPL